MNGTVIICNQALGLAGCGKTISDINEVSAEAKICKRYYDSCRQKLLCMSQWNFATGVTELAQSIYTHPKFSCVYMYPDTVLRINRIYSAELVPEIQEEQTETETEEVTLRPVLEQGEGSEYSIEKIYGEKFVCTNAQNAFASVIYDIKETSDFPPLFSSALVLLLASEISVPLSGGNLSTRQALYQQFMNEYYAAATMHANEARQLPHREFEEYCEARL